MGRAAQRRFHDTIKTIHTYLGLFVFLQLIVFGTAGLVATFSTPEAREPATTSVREVPFTVPAGRTEKEIADAVHAELDLSLTGPIPQWALRHDSTGRLLLDFSTVNGVHRVTVEPDRSQLRLVTERVGFWHFLSRMHSSLRVYDRSGDWRMEAWTAYVEIAIWSFLLMAASGLYLWLSARARYRPALVAIMAGSAAFLILYFATR